jgi:hypothetical protein
MREGGNHTHRDVFQLQVREHMSQLDAFSREKILTGNPEIGTVEYIRIPLQRPEEREQGLHLRAEFHAATLDFLRKGGYKTIFAEGHAYVRPADTDIAILSRVLKSPEYVPFEVQEAERIRDMFTTFNLNDITIDQRRALLEYGAHNVCAMLDDSVSIVSIAPLPNVSGKKRDTYHARQRYIAKQVRRHLDTHRGEKVAIIANDYDHFSFDFRRDLPLERGWWRGPFKQFGERKKKERPVVTEVSSPRYSFALDATNVGSIPAASEARKYIDAVREGYIRSKRGLRSQQRVSGLVE